MLINLFMIFDKDQVDSASVTQLSIKSTKNRKNLNLCTVYNFQAQLAE